MPARWNAPEVEESRFRCGARRDSDRAAPKRSLLAGELAAASVLRPWPLRGSVGVSPRWWPPFAPRERRREATLPESLAYRREN